MENERRIVLLGVFQRSMVSSLKRKQTKEINQNREDLEANEFDTVTPEDHNSGSEEENKEDKNPEYLESTVPTGEAVKIDKMHPPESSTSSELVSNILLETQPYEKIEKNLYM